MRRTVVIACLRPAVLALTVVAAGCGLPRDAAGTRDRITRGTMRVGLIEAPPWTIEQDGRVGGVEGELVAGLAASLGASIEWIREPAPKLLTALHDRQLDLVIGGLTAKLPWKQEVAFTRPYYRNGEDHVLAAPPGENAWLVTIERYLRQHEGDVELRVAAASP